MPDNRAKNQVDYILVNRHTNLTNVEVLNRVTGSDHRMVRATICINVKSDRTKLIMTRHIPVVATQDQIDQYRLELTNSLQVFAVVDEDIDQANSQLIKTMKDAAKKANPTCNQSLNKFSATTLSLMNRRNDLIIRNSEDLLEKRDLNKTIHKRQRTETRAYNQRIVETTIKEGKGYKTAKKRLAIGNRQIASLKNADGEIVTDREEILRIGERFYQTLYTSSLNIHPTYSFSEDEEDPIPDITRIEVESAIKTLKSGKSAGEDGISSTLIKKGGSLMAIQLAQLFTNSQAGHGTRCAGEIVAAPNNFCGVGISYGAQISGIRILDEAVTDSMEATAFSYQTDINDIYSCSWGPVDDGATIEGPMYLTQKAILRGITLGRKGYGVIYVVASGNGRTSGDNCNFDGFSSSPYTITIGALNQYDIAATFSEACASVNAVTYGEGLWNDIVTTDIMRRPDNSYFSKNSGCTLSHKGTSAAAPLASAMIALMLEANPCLSWRDVQYIIMLTATKLEFNSTKWLTNAAGISHSLLYGFGKLNAWHLSNIAKVWKSVPWSTVFISEVIDVQKPIPSKFQPLQSVVYVNRTIVSYYGLSIVENVQVSIILSYPIRGYLQIRLMSPSKTVSVIAEPRFNDKSANGYSGWKFSSLQFWGENPIGNWTLLVTSLGKIESGLLKSWFLIIHGTPMSSKEFLERKSFVENSMNHNFLATGKTAACKKPLESLTSSEEFGIRALRMLFMTSICMFFYATWDIIESAYCKRTEKTLEINQTSTPETIEDEETALLSNVS
ncbi:Proprotein convertase subtilisin/kexin type 7 [Nymphon striatum]|nr:Proprotein convertase subtilisin/kexin type 7 [Nymphon striatum]